MNSASLITGAVRSVLHPKQFARQIQDLPDEVWKHVATSVLGGKTSNAEVYGRPIRREN